jgi:hypothetical protein
MRSPITETIRRVQGMILYVQENLSSDEYNLFLDMVDPQPEVTKPTRKKRASKSPRAQSLSSVIAQTPKPAAPADSAPCVYQYPKDGEIKPGVICGSPADDTIHDRSMGYAGYHEFDAPKVKKAAK